MNNQIKNILRQSLYWVFTKRCGAWEGFLGTYLHVFLATFTNESSFKLKSDWDQNFHCKHKSASQLKIKNHFKLITFNWVWLRIVNRFNEQNCLWVFFSVHFMNIYLLVCGFCYKNDVNCVRNKNPCNCHFYRMK